MPTDESWADSAESNVTSSTLPEQVLKTEGCHSTELVEGKAAESSSNAVIGVDVQSVVRRLQLFLNSEACTSENIKGYYETVQLSTKANDDVGAQSRGWCTTLGELTYCAIAPSKLKVLVRRRAVFLGSLDDIENCYAVTYEMNFLSHYLEAMVVAKGTYSNPDTLHPNVLHVQLCQVTILPLSGRGKLQDWLDIFKFQNQDMDDGTGILHVQLPEPVAVVEEVLLKTKTVQVVQSVTCASILKRLDTPDAVACGDVPDNLFYGGPNIMF